MTGELGAGPALDELFDLDPNNSGGLRISSGVDELGKDVAMNSAIVLQNAIGQRADEQVAPQIEDDVRGVMLQDSRILRVTSLTVRRTDRRGQSFEVSAVVRTIDGEQDLVFEV